MYLNFFNLREPPFNLTPDPRFLFLSPQHEEALDHLLYGIRERKGFIEITGEVGTGKTMLCRALLDRLDTTVSTALVFNSYLNDLELLQAILHDFGLQCQETTRKGYLDVLNEFLLQEFTAGRNAVVVVDEAQNLEPRVLEQLRMLSNLETERGKLLQVILVGQPELRDKLATHQMRQLEQRIAVRYHIQSLSRRDMQPYLTHRLSVAGGATAVTFTSRALTLIYRYSAGLPRRINLLGDRALVTAYVRGTHRVTARIVRQSIRDLGGDWQPAPTQRPRRWPAALATGVALGVGVGLGGLLSGTWGRPEFLQRLELALPTQVLARIPAAAPPAPAPPSAASPQPALLPNQPLTASPAPPPRSWTDAELQMAHTLWQLKTQAEGNLTRPAPGTSLPWEIPLRQVANPTGFDILPLQMGTLQLSRIARPCFIEVLPEVSAPQPMLWVLVKGLHDQALVYREPEGVIAIPLQHLRRIWSGKFYFTLEEGKYRGVVLRQGMQHTRIQAVQQVLKDLGYFPDAPSGRFDVQTYQAVRDFQRDYQLTIDGQVGRQTLILLWHFGAPTLDETI